MPTICFCRREQKEKACGKLGIPFRVSAGASSVLLAPPIDAAQHVPPQNGVNGGAAKEPRRAVGVLEAVYEAVAPQAAAAEPRAPSPAGCAARKLTQCHSESLAAGERAAAVAANGALQYALHRLSLIHI